MVVNRIFSEAQFWDGRAATLEQQVTEPIFSPYEMKNTPEGLVAFLESTPGYRRQFEVIFGGVSVEAVGKALACFVRVLVTGESPYDYWREKEAWKGRDLTSATEAQRQKHEQLLALARQSPFSTSARKGYELFVGKAGCSHCHAGPNFTDEKYHNVGVGMDEADPDLGRARVMPSRPPRSATSL
jgi:cytochrome c peroxidase